MRIGFCGAHRTGKSTLARQISKIYGLPLLSSVAGSIAERFNFNMATDSRVSTAGLAMQRTQLLTMVEQIEGAPGGFVCDRTPLDAAAYLLADATASAGDHLQREDVVEYVEEAKRLTARHFDVVILVPPAIVFEAVDGKPPQNPAYQEHHHLLVQGMLWDDEVSIRSGQILRTNTDRANRIAAVCDFIGVLPTPPIESAAA